MSGQTQFAALSTIMNGSGCVRRVDLMMSKKQELLDGSVDDMKDSMHMYGHDAPSLIATDDCERQKGFWIRKFGLQAGRTKTDNIFHLPQAKLPDGFEINTLRSSDVETVNDMCEAIRASLTDGEGVVGLDCEWDEPAHVAALQLAIAHRGWLISVSAALSQILIHLNCSMRGHISHRSHQQMPK